MNQNSSRYVSSPGLAVWTFAVSLTGCVLVPPVQGAGGADLSNLVIAGDSLSAGYQNSQLIQRGQEHGYANVLAVQAKQDLRLPLVSGPGYPQVNFVPVLPGVTGVQVDPNSLPANAPFLFSSYGPTRDVA